MSALHSLTLGQGPQLVLIPGWGMHSGVWGEFGERLAADFRLTLVDLPGHGLSPAWADWTLADTAAALAELIQGQAVWLGWSLGGQIALEFARRWSVKVKSLVLVATNPKFIADGRWPGVAQEVFDSLARELEIDAQAALNRFLALSCLGEADVRGVLRRLKRAWGSYSPPAPCALRQGLEILRRTDLRPALAEINCQVAVVAGEKDRLVPVAAARQLAARLPQAKLAILAGTGHAPFLSQPEELAALVRALAA